MIPLLSLLACSGSSFDPDEVPAFDAVERVLLVGDNTASNPSWSTGYAALLQDNDDLVFPGWAGHDLGSWLPDAEVLRLDRGGDSYAALGVATVPIEVPPGDLRPTLVTVGLGLNDMVSVALQLLTDTSLQDHPEWAIEDFQDAVHGVLSATEDTWVFPRSPLVAVANLYDPSDGVGDLAELVTQLFPFEGADAITPELALTIIDGFNAAIAAEAEEHGAVLVDLHTPFLGHGLHWDDEDNPHHDPADATPWLQGVIDPQLRGAHEIRRAFFNTLAGTALADVPTDLPLASTAGLPDVPDDGWAKAVVDSEVTPELDSGSTVFTNIAADPEQAVGAPTGGGVTDVVALGVLGAWMILDLGEETKALDGEGEDLVVLEFGTLSGGVPEPYRAYASDEPDGPWTILGDGSGERAFDLAEAGLTDGVRYVLIESLAQEVDVLGGVGSPYYPGPEFDAVGAVYPGP